MATGDGGSLKKEWLPTLVGKSDDRRRAGATDHRERDTGGKTRSSEREGGQARRASSPEALSLRQ